MPVHVSIVLSTILTHTLRTFPTDSIALKDIKLSIPSIPSKGNLGLVLLRSSNTGIHYVPLPVA